MKLRYAAAVLSIGAAVLPAVSQAAVIEWGYAVNSFFTAAAYEPNPGPLNPLPNTTLVWGTSFPRSSLVINPSSASGSVDTYFGTTPPQTAPFLGLSTSVTHNNNPIEGGSLVSATLRNNVSLTPLDPLRPALPTQVVNFNIGFDETPNATPCVVVSSPTPCNDIFVLTSGLLNQTFVYDAFDGDGALTYFVNIFPVTGGVLTTLAPAVCASVGQGPGCIGFTTPERQSTTLAFGFTISSAALQIPEPATLALVGLGLLGFALRRAHRG